ncbi:MAG: hypothetical protein JRG92_11080 [Deltaproteobacteria bacterium]|nr:hypothetical protein [Deltaproteobacteria bacterium]
MTANTTHLIPNLGAEETREWARFAASPAVARTVALWRLLFGPGNRLIGLDGLEKVDGVDESWPKSLGRRPDAAVFGWLEALASAAWLADEDAAALARSQGVPLVSSPPDVVRSVHDKAFALEAAREQGEEPRPLRGLCRVFSPAALEHAAASLEEIESELTRWPAWTAGRFTLKPRHGSSGRGRVGGQRDTLDADAILGALPRLAQCGGALLEPWLERTQDLSVVMHLGHPDAHPDSRAGSHDNSHADAHTDAHTDARAEPAVTILGSLEQRVSDSGVYLGHQGEIDSRGRVFSGSAYDEPMRGAAAAIAGRARSAGYAGPCGVDGFVFRLQDPGEDVPREVLRPIVEFNARFTVGIIVVGLIRRALAQVKQSLDLAPGERLGFLFALECPAAWTSWQSGFGELGERTLLLPLASESDGGGPALLFTDQLARIRAALE